MTPPETIDGERGTAQVGHTLSRSVRLQRRLALVIIALIGAGALGAYYVHLEHAAPAPTHASTGAAVASEMKLPALSAAPASPKGIARPPGSGNAPSEPAEGTTGSVVDLAAQGRAAPFEASVAAPSPAPRQPTAAVSPSRSGSPVLLRSAAAETAAAPRGDTTASFESLAALASSPGAAERPPVIPPPSAETLVPTASAPVQATVLASRRWLLPKGSFLDCTLETAIDSTLPGMVTCVLAIDVYGADGRVVLLERGTKLVGETRSEARAGQARVAVLWSEARTPTGVVVALASPATDALGRAGVPGEVDNHFRARFGAAVLLSIIDGVISAAVAHAQGSVGVVNNAQGTQSIATEALRNTIGIPPTINVAPGARIQVFVARDVDFAGVYRLSSRAEH